MSVSPSILLPVSLDHNLPCLRCGYNLRTLSPDARCPECSTPIAASLNPALLRYDDPAWTSILALACGLILICGCIELIYIIYSLFTIESESLANAFVFVEPTHAFINPLSWLAVFLLGHPHPRPQTPPRRFSIRRVMRIAALIAMISAIVADSGVPDFSQVLPDWLFEFPIDHAIELFATIPLFIYLLQLAGRTGLPSLQVHTKIALVTAIIARIAWAFLDNYAADYTSQEATTAAHVLLMPVFLYQLYVFLLLRRTLRKSTAVARQYWHLCSPMPLQPQEPIH